MRAMTFSAATLCQVFSTLHLSHPVVLSCQLHFLGVLKSSADVVSALCCDVNEAAPADHVGSGDIAAGQRVRHTP